MSMSTAMKMWYEVMMNLLFVPKMCERKKLFCLNQKIEWALEFDLMMLLADWVLIQNREDRFYHYLPYECLRIIFGFVVRKATSWLWVAFLATSFVTSWGISSIDSIANSFNSRGNSLIASLTLFASCKASSSRKIYNNQIPKTKLAEIRCIHWSWEKMVAKYI